HRRWALPQDEGEVPFYWGLPSPCKSDLPAFGELQGRTMCPGRLAGGLLGAVVLEVYFDRLAFLDSDVLFFCPVLLVPGLDRVLAGRDIVDLDRAVRAGHRLVGVLGDADVAAHPGM